MYYLIDQKSGHLVRPTKEENSNILIMTWMVVGRAANLACNSPSSFGYCISFSRAHPVSQNLLHFSFIGAYPLRFNTFCFVVLAAGSCSGRSRKVLVHQSIASIAVTCCSSTRKIKHVRGSSLHMYCHKYGGGEVPGIMNCCWKFMGRPGTSISLGQWTGAEAFRAATFYNLIKKEFLVINCGSLTSRSLLIPSFRVSISDRWPCSSRRSSKASLNRTIFRAAAPLNLFLQSERHTLRHSTILSWSWKRHTTALATST